jgi:hypothetical protein
MLEDLSVFRLFCSVFRQKQNKTNPLPTPIGIAAIEHDSICTGPPREEVFMEGPIEPNMGPSLADVLLCTFERTNAGFSSFPVRKLLS